eukprot:SAG31_NODE_79_length_27235_cov_6.268868_7_plen_187_part_00
MAPAVACAAGNDCGCKWGEELSGLDKQCMGLGAAPGGHISASDCEAFCCHHSRFGTGGEYTTADGVKGGFCDLWQWLPVSALPDSTYKWNCFVGVSGTVYPCGKNQPALAHVSWSGSRQCLGVAPASWGWPFVLMFALSAALYFGGCTVYRQHIHGLAGWAALPHAVLWRELHALVADGMEFVRGN